MLATSGYGIKFMFNVVFCLYKKNSKVYYFQGIVFVAFRNFTD